MPNEASRIQIPGCEQQNMNTWMAYFFCIFSVFLLVSRPTNWVSSTLITCKRSIRIHKRSPFFFLDRSANKTKPVQQRWSARRRPFTQLLCVERFMRRMAVTRAWNICFVDTISIKLTIKIKKERRFPPLFVIDFGSFYLPTCLHSFHKMIRIIKIFLSLISVYLDNLLLSLVQQRARYRLEDYIATTFQMGGGGSLHQWI